MTHAAIDTLLAFIDRRRRFLFILVAILLLLPLNLRWRLGPDSMLYVSLARALAAGDGYHTLGWPRANAHFGLPLLLAANFRLFTPLTLWPALLFTFLSGLLALAFTYRLFLFRLPRPHAFAVTLLFATCFTFNAYLYELLTEIPGYLGLIAALTAFEALVYGPPLSLRHRAAWFFLLLAGLWLGAAMRPVTWALLPAMGAVLAGRAFRTPAHRWTALFTLVLFVLGLGLFYAFDPRPNHAGEAHEAWLHKVLLEQPRQTLDIILHHTLPMILGPTSVEACFGISPGRLLSIPFAILLFLAAALATRKHPLWLLWIVGNFFMLLVYPEPQTRYFLPILPFLALGFFQLARTLGSLRSRPVALTALSLCLAVWLAPNLARFAGLIYRQHFTAFLPALDYGRYLPFQQMADRLTTLPRDALIVSEDAATLQAFHPTLHLMMTIQDNAPPDLAAQLPTLLATDNLYIVDDNPGRTARILASQNLHAGPPLLTIRRPAWELPRFPQRLFTTISLPDLAPLTLRHIYAGPSRPSLHTE